MPKFVDKKILNYSSEQLFNLVANIEEYPNFLPWCKSATILNNQDDIVIAQLSICFGLVSDSYISNVKLDPYNRINVESIKGPFKYLYNNWYFKEIESGTEVIFEIDFQFKSIILEKLVGKIFVSLIKKISLSFEQRAKEIYTKY